MYMTLYLFGAFLLSFVCGLVFTPLILAYCKRKKLYDIPNERKVHTNAVPRMGGISFFPSMSIAFITILFFLTPTNRHIISLNIWNAVFLVGLFLIYVTGIVDDLMGLKAHTKFTIQTLTAGLLPLSGLYINNFYGLLGIYEVPAYVGVPLTIFIMVFIDNAINLIDGIDGLAAGLSLLALAGFLCYFIQYGVFVRTYSILIAGLIGALLAFGYFNIFGKPERNTKLFMGDSGSLSLGYTLGFLSIRCAMDNTNIWPMRPEALLVPATLLFVPMADVVRVTLYRIIHHMPLFKADKNHIHHKLMRAGLSQHQALAVILVFSIFIIVINSFFYNTIHFSWILVLDGLLYSFINIFINRKMGIELKSVEKWKN